MPHLERAWWPSLAVHSGPCVHRRKVNSEGRQTKELLDCGRPGRWQVKGGMELYLRCPGQTLPELQELGRTEVRVFRLTQDSRRT